MPSPLDVSPAWPLLLGVLQQLTSMDSVQMLKPGVSYFYHSQSRVKAPSPPLHSWLTTHLTD